MRKSNYLGEHPARLQDPPANSTLQVGTSITNPCYLKREWGRGNLTGTGACCGGSKATACGRQISPAHPGTTPPAVSLLIVFIFFPDHLCQHLKSQWCCMCLKCPFWDLSEASRCPQPGQLSAKVSPFWQPGINRAKQCLAGLPECRRENPGNRSTFTILFF